MNQGKILLVDDDQSLLEALPEALRLRMGVSVDTADSAAAALDRIADREYDAIVTDIRMPGMDGLELLEEIRTRRPGTPTLMITGHGESDLVVRALRAGAADFIHKPIDREYLVKSLRRAIEVRQRNVRVEQEQVALTRHVQELEALAEDRERRLKQVKKAIDDPISMLMGSGRRMEKVVQQIRQVARSPLTVLVEGETGTGKELAARAIHQLSARRDKPFVAVDCGAIPETLIESELFGFEKGAFTGAHQRKVGQFQLAAGGTLFLDEIVNLPLATQAKLLRVLQQRQVQPVGGTLPIAVDVRIIAAANLSLEEEVRQGRFRADVLYRLNEFLITLPPLRERDDIVELAHRFVEEASIELCRPCRRISEAAAQALLRYHWPGNVRELRNVIRRACLLASEVIEPAHLTTITVERTQPDGPILRDPALGTTPGAASLRELAEAAMADAEAQAIRVALQATAGNKSKAARLLRVDYKTLHTKMKQYGLDATEFRGSSLSSSS